MLGNQEVSPNMGPELCFDPDSGKRPAEQSGELVTKCERGHYPALRAWCVVCPWSFPGDRINGGGGMGLDTMANSIRMYPCINGSYHIHRRYLTVCW